MAPRAPPAPVKALLFVIRVPNPLVPEASEEGNLSMHDLTDCLSRSIPQVLIVTKISPQSCRRGSAPLLVHNAAPRPAAPLRHLPHALLHQVLQLCPQPGT